MGGVVTVDRSRLSDVGWAMLGGLLGWCILAFAWVLFGEGGLFWEWFL